MKASHVFIVLIFVFCQKGACQSPAQFRRDYFLDSSLYPEPFGPPLPTTGGRLHFVVSATASSTTFQLPYSISVAGFTLVLDGDINVTQSTAGQLDWIQLFVTDTSPAKAVLSFHTTSDSLLQNSFPSFVSVFDANNKTVVLGTTKLVIPSASNDGLSVTYVTTTKNYTAVVIHLHNFGPTTVQVNSLVLNAIMIPTSSVHLPFTIPPNGGHVTLTAPSLTSLHEGSVWTLEINASTSTGDTLSIGNGGRFGKEVFFVQGWQHDTVGCEGPTGPDPDTYYFFRNEIGMNGYYGWGTKCDVRTASTATSAIANGYFILANAEQNIAYDPKVFPALMGIEVGDEVDGDVAHVVTQLRLSLNAAKNNPGIMVYQGASTNHIIGRFAGITDIQGVDFYVAGCAPHITPAFNTMRLQGSRDYLRNMRNNHMPLQSWGYSQFVAKDWNTVPNGNEVVVQLASVALAGAKSLMLFQPDEALIGNGNVAVAGGFIASMRAIGELLRTGDTEGAILSSSDGNTTLVSMVDVIQAPNNTFVFVVVSTNGEGYNDILCYTGISNHWSFQPHTIDWLEASVQFSPSGAGTPTKMVLSEIVKGQQVNPVNGVTGSFTGNIIRLSNIVLGTQDDIARIFVAMLL